MKRSSLCLLVAVQAAALSGCATQVRFESDPPGAQITYEEKGRALGSAPFDTDIHDDFGWFSVYRFTARLEGYEPQVVEFRERTPLDAQRVVPPVVRFELKKPSSVALQAQTPAPSRE